MKPARSNSPSPGGNPVGEAVGVVVRVGGTARAVVDLDADDQFAGKRGDGVEVAGATLVVPDVDADATVGPIGGLDQPPGVVDVDDVGERQELEADDEAVVGGTVAHAAEGAGGVGRGQLGRPDALQVPALERVGHPPCRRLDLGRVVAAATVAAEPGHDLDLRQQQVVLVEQVAQSPGRLTGVLEGAVVAGPQPDAGEPVRRGQADAVVDRVLRRPRLKWLSTRSSGPSW